MTCTASPPLVRSTAPAARGSRSARARSAPLLSPVRSDSPASDRSRSGPTPTTLQVNIENRVNGSPYTRGIPVCPSSSRLNAAASSWHAARVSCTSPHATGSYCVPICACPVRSSTTTAAENRPNGSGVTGGASTHSRGCAICVSCLLP